jgi:hypothetical protein
MDWIGREPGPAASIRLLGFAGHQVKRRRPVLSFIHSGTPFLLYSITSSALCDCPGDISCEVDGEAVGGSHADSSAANRRPDRYNARCSALR